MPWSTGCAAFTFLRLPSGSEVSRIYFTGFLLLPLGLVFSAQSYAAAPCTLNATNPSVTVCTPAPNTLVQSPVHVVAGTTDSNTVTAVQVYVDSKLTQSFKASTIDTFINLPIGFHKVGYHR